MSYFPELLAKRNSRCFKHKYFSPWLVIVGINWHFWCTLAKFVVRHRACFITNFCNFNTSLVIFHSNLYDTLVRSVLTYGLIVWNLNEVKYYCLFISVHFNIRELGSYSYLYHSAFCIFIKVEGWCRQSINAQWPSTASCSVIEGRDHVPYSSPLWPGWACYSQ